MIMCSRSPSALDDTVEYDITTTHQSWYMKFLYLVRLDHEHVIVVLRADILRVWTPAVLEENDLLRREVVRNEPSCTPANK